MPPRPQLTREERNFCLLEYAKRKGGRNFFQGILADFHTKFPGARLPDQTTVRRLYKKQLKNGTVNNSGRSPENIGNVKAVMDHDAPKRIGDDTVSPVSTARRNVLGIDKSTWSRIKLELRYFS